jgi:glutamate synthase domain-containing protein 1
MENDSYKLTKGTFTNLAQGFDLNVICWRKLKTNSECLGSEAKKTEPLMRQVFITATYAESDPKKFERNTYLLRKQCVHHTSKQGLKCYVVSLSVATIIYKV